MGQYLNWQRPRKSQPFDDGCGTSGITIIQAQRELIWKGIASRIARLNLTEKQAAEQIGIAHSALWTFKTGQRGVSRVKMRKIAAWLRLTRPT